MALSDPPGKARPWPVYLLVSLSVAGLIWGLLFDHHRNAWDAALVALSLWLTYSLWIGKRWAFTLSFMAATLCLAGLILVLSVQALLLEQGVNFDVLPALLLSGVWVVLLLHPDTKRFAGLSRRTTGGRVGVG